MALLVGDTSPSTGSGNQPVSAPAPRRRRSSGGKRRTGGGGGGGNNRRRGGNNNNRNRGGGGGRDYSGAAGRRASQSVNYNKKGQAVSTPKVPSLAQFLQTDTPYKNQLAMFAKALKQFMSDLDYRRNTTKSNFADTEFRMGQERTSALEDIEADFAARGLLSSGLYGEAVGEYEQNYAQQMSDVEKQLAEALQGFSTEQQTFESEQEAAKKSAEQEAAARRAAKFGV